MKFLISLLIIFGITYSTYRIFLQIFSKQKKNKIYRQQAFAGAAFIGVILLGCLAFLLYRSATAPDIQCTRLHDMRIHFPTTLQTAEDYFDAGNYFYDSGSCQQAVNEYSQAIQLDPKFKEAYNNRAYTNMRLRNYQEALTDLNAALSIDPNYVTALMNRGDLYNYYGPVINRSKAIADYKKVISLGVSQDMSGSVCGHLAMAQTNNQIPLVFLRLLFHKGYCE